MCVCVCLYEAYAHVHKSVKRKGNRKSKRGGVRKKVKILRGEEGHVII